MAIRRWRPRLGVGAGGLAVTIGGIAGLLIGSSPGRAAALAAAPPLDVEIRAYRYEPAALSVVTGDTVVWTNDDAAPHTVTSSSGPVVLQSPELERGEAWSFTFTRPGTYPYYCAVHPYMRGSVTVAPAPAPPANRVPSPAPPVLSPPPHPAGATPVGATPAGAALPSRHVVAAAAVPTTTSPAPPVVAPPAAAATTTVSGFPVGPSVLVGAFAAALVVFVALRLAARP